MKTLKSSVVGLALWVALCAATIGVLWLAFNVPPAPFIGFVLVALFVAWVAGWLRLRRRI